MQFTKQDIEQLKNACRVNSQMWIPSTGKVAVVDNEKTLAIFFQLQAKLSKDFGVYDMNELLGILGLYENPTITEGETELTVSAAKGDRKTSYRYTSKDCIVIPPDASKFEDMLKDVKDSVEVSKEDISAIKEHSTVIKAPHIILSGSSITAKDNDNPSSNSVTFEVAGANFPETVLLRENFIKLIDDAYTIRTDGKRTELKSKSGLATYYTSRIASTAAPKKDK